MTFMTKTFLAASTMAMAANAVPSVTPYELASDCSFYPKDGFFVEVNQCTDVETGETCAYEGFRGQATYREDDTGFITIVTNEEIQPTNLTCTAGSRGVTMITLEDEYGPSVGMYDVEGTQMLAWEDGPIVQPMLYSHLLEDGTVAPDAFMGHSNVTTWAVRYASVEPVKDSYYAVRLNVDGELREGESEAFLRIAT